MRGDGVGRASNAAARERLYVHARPFLFGCDESGVGVDLTEPLAFLDLLEELDIQLFSVSAGGAGIRESGA